jgi:pimeloyl-ACP methyl ester carboxylesterase
VAEALNFPGKNFLMHKACITFLTAAFCLASGQEASAAAQCSTETFPAYRLQFCRYPAPGPLLVLDAAQGTDMQVWDQDFIKALNGYAEVLTYNRVGSGDSAFVGRALNAPITAEGSSRRLHRLLQRLYPKRKVILLGHSMGGLYAQYFARAYPHQLAGLVLIDAASALEPKENSPFENKSVIRKGSITYFEGEGFRQSVRQIEQAPAFPTIPLLVLSADRHSFATPAIEALWQETQKKVARQSAQGRQVTVPDSEHFIFISHRDRVVGEIGAMIEENGLR